MPRDPAVKSHFRSPRQRPQQVRLARKPQKPHTLHAFTPGAVKPLLLGVCLAKAKLGPSPFPPLRARRLNCTLSCTLFQSMRSANLTLYLFVASGADIMRVIAGF